jgi:NAD(P)H-hydrate epimerase
MIITKSKEMKAIDQKAINDYGIPGTILMEHAAICVCEEIYNLGKKVTIICGTGNNGGDGFAIARNLSMNGKIVTVIGIGRQEALVGDALIMYQSISHLDLNIHWYDKNQDFIYSCLLYESDVIVDAIFGTGCNRVVEGNHLKMIQQMNKAKAYTISVDMPSGVNSDNGKVMGLSVCADLCVTFTLPKLGNLLYPGASSCKRLKIVNIGIPQKVLEDFSFDYETIDQETLVYMPIRVDESHKNTYGKILVIAGSTGMSGAAYLAAKAAYRCGTGLVEILTHEDCKQALQSSLPEAIISTYNNDNVVLREGLLNQLHQYKAILIGPGISKSDIAYEWLEFVLTQSEVPVVIDADGLNLLSKHMELLENCVVPLILTPHIGEMTRLTLYPTSAILENTIEFAQAFSKANQVTTVLKSGRTVVSTPDGKCCINVCGNHGMATAGSGDVLAGVIVSLLGQGANPTKSAVLGVAIHSLAGDLAAKDKGYSGLMASDIIDAIPYVLKTKN